MARGSCAHCEESQGCSHLQLVALNDSIWRLASGENICPSPGNSLFLNRHFEPSAGDECPTGAHHAPFEDGGLWLPHGFSGSALPSFEQNTVSPKSQDYRYVTFNNDS